MASNQSTTKSQGLTGRIQSLCQDWDYLPFFWYCIDILVGPDHIRLVPGDPWALGPSLCLWLQCGVACFSTLGSLLSTLCGGAFTCVLDASAASLLHVDSLYCLAIKRLYSIAAQSLTSAADEPEIWRVRVKLWMNEEKVIIGAA